MKLPQSIIKMRYERKLKASELISNTEFNKLRILTQQLLNSDFKTAVKQTRIALNLSYSTDYLQSQVLLLNKESHSDLLWIDRVLDKVLDKLNTDNVWD